MRDFSSFNSLLNFETGLSPPLFKQTCYSKFMFRQLNPTVINVLIFKVTEKV